MVKCINCKYYISDEFCKPYEEKDYDFEIDGENSEHNCPNFKEKVSSVDDHYENMRYEAFNGRRIFY